ncbi:MAG TPA: hypothetical protein VHZ77_04615 [Gaiellaceae bacterium]|nr:hypothetical protein [Gaiellaceae bacterium]
MSRRLLFAALAAIAASFVVLVAAAGADTLGPITFEMSQGYVMGDINMQPLTNDLPNGKWEKSGPYDAQVASVAAFPAAAGYGFVGQALRISDAMTSGSFGDQTFSPGLADEAGEKTADNAGLSGGLRQPTLTASFMIGTTQATEQPGLHLAVSPDRGDGSRMSYLRFEDQSNGVHVFFDDVKDPGPVGHVADFRESDIATLDRTQSHVITFQITFKDGPHNDQVQIYIDGKKKKDGTTWEDYYRYDPEQTPSGNKVPTVDKLLFRESGTANPLDAGKGFLIDRVLLTSSGRTT